MNLTACQKTLLQEDPDTDIYHIGLPLVSSSKQVIVQVGPMHSNDLKFLDMPALVKALQKDPDVSHIQPTILPCVLQTLCVWWL